MWCILAHYGINHLGHLKKKKSEFNSTLRKLVVKGAAVDRIFTDIKMYFKAFISINQSQIMISVSSGL